MTAPHPNGLTASPKVYLLISVLIGLTASRALAIAFLPKLTMFGGAAPDVWLGPWVTDAILGLMIPAVIIALNRVRAGRVWGCILLYNGIGAFDYLTGLATQALHPLPTSIAPTALVFGSLSLTLASQVAVVVLLFRRDVIDDFFGSSR